MSKTLPNLSLEQVLSGSDNTLSLNTCRNPDCENFTEAPVFGRPHHSSKKGKAARRKQNNFGRTKGDYKLQTPTAEYRRETKINATDKVEWCDNRSIVCSACGTKQNILSEEALADEIKRLVSLDGVLDGPSPFVSGCLVVSHS